jgi:beta-galactosidase
MPLVTRRTLLRSGIAASAASLVSTTAMARAHAALTEFGGLEPMAAGPRERLLMDFGWKFFFGNANDPSRDLGFGYSQGDFSKGGTFDFATAKFDDSKWSALDLPHDWAVELPYVDDKELDGHGYKPLGRRFPLTSVGWYRRSFDVPQSDAGRRLSIDFDGAFREVLVFLNGYLIGRNTNGYAPFSFDVTDYIVFGGKNFITVRVDASFGDGWFYEGAGIYRHVWMTKTDALHLASWESTIRTEVADGAATLKLETLVKNDAKHSGACSVSWKVLDAQKNVVATAAAARQELAEDTSATFTATARLARPALWSPDSPALYTAVVSVESAGKVLDAEAIPFGVRTVHFDADKGFSLNGKPMKVQGTCNHQDHAGVGVALPDALQYYRLGVLKEMGSNAVRTSHNMPTPEWVAGCDRMGMMMMCETRVMGSTPEALAILANMIKRYRNSPSVILWSMGNEEWVLQTNDTGKRVVATMVEHAHELDPTRLCTAAVNGSYGLGFDTELDVMGFNYNLTDIEKYHAAHPLQPLIGSETASSTGTRGIYTNDRIRNWVAEYDTMIPRWAETPETWWKFYAEREYLAGGFAWTGFDYRGEPTPYSWPSINSQFGIVDMCGFPKDAFFYYKSWWGTEPVLHLLPHWNWQQRIGEPIDVVVYSNLDEVELLLNGKSLGGTQKMERHGHLQWSVKYEPGVLEARGSRGGKVVLTEKRETTGEPATLRLSADRSTIDADGEDLANIRVEALDSQGRWVPTATDIISFKIAGAGALLGVGNGDPNCHESDKEPKRSLFSGLAQVIVQATKTPGTLTVEAYTEEWPGPKLQPATITITTQKVTPRPAI